MTIFQSIRVGIFLGWRQIRRSSLWSTVLIIAIMTLTFLNLVFVSGILVGLIEGATFDYREKYAGDILIKNLPTKNYVLNSQEVIQILRGIDTVQGVTARYMHGATLEANYRTKVRPSDRHDSVGVTLIGINPETEANVMSLPSNLLVGDYLEVGDEESILIGNYLLKDYSNVDFPGEETLENVHVGSKVKITVNGKEKELTVKGILKSKVDEISIRAYVTDTLLRKMAGRFDYNVSEIAVRLKPGASPSDVKAFMLEQGLGDYAKINTWEESLGEFFNDIKNTFSLLGAFLGSIGLAVATITVFIVIFINAITRRKYIGIMKGIGISPVSIEISYVVQSMIYAVIGSALGVALVYGLAVPYFMQNPIDFPFSDGILVAPWNETIIKLSIIIISTMIAGYLPAKIVSRTNTLNAILGR